MCRDLFVVPVIAGVFALAGAFLGALLTRRTGYQKWLRQERSVAFAEFLRQLHTVVERAIPIVSGPEAKQERELKVTELFMGLNAQEYIVRLYLRPGDRDTFSELTKRLWILHCPSTEPERRVIGVRDTLREIQSLFEKTLDARLSHHNAHPGREKTP